jgi:hypothetical protein
MKANTILILSLILSLSGCARSTNYNLNGETEFSDKSVLLLQAKGNDLTGIANLTVLSIDGTPTQYKYSATRLEFKPGSYELEFGVDAGHNLAAGIALGMTVGVAATNTYLYGSNTQNPNTLTYRLNMKPGHFYLASYDITNDNKVLIKIEEI